MEHCPACRARYKGESICARCGADLTLPLRSEQQARNWLRLAVQHLLKADRASTEAALQQALLLNQLPLAVSLDAFLKQAGTLTEFLAFAFDQRPVAAPETPLEPPVDQKSPSHRLEHILTKSIDFFSNAVASLDQPQVHHRLQRWLSNSTEKLVNLGPVLLQWKKQTRADEPERRELNRLTEAVVSAAREVHQLMGPGLRISTYEACLCHELDLREIGYQLHCTPSLTYKNKALDTKAEINLVVADQIAVLIDGVEKRFTGKYNPLLPYLKFGDWQAGVLIDFNVAVLKPMTSAYTKERTRK